MRSWQRGGAISIYWTARWFHRSLSLVSNNFFWRESSNSPFWYCNAGMNYVVGPGWRDQWDVVITSAGKPAFYTEDNRPFREVDIVTGKVKFKQVRYLSEVFFLRGFGVDQRELLTIWLILLPQPGWQVGERTSLYIRMPKRAHSANQLALSAFICTRWKRPSLQWHILSIYKSQRNVHWWLSLCGPCGCKTRVWVDYSRRNSGGGMGNRITAKERIHHCGSCHWNAPQYIAIISTKIRHRFAIERRFGGYGQAGENSVKMEGWTNSIARQSFWIGLPCKIHTILVCTFITSVLRFVHEQCGKSSALQSTSSILPRNSKVIIAWNTWEQSRVLWDVKQTTWYLTVSSFYHQLYRDNLPIGLMTDEVLFEITIIIQSTASTTCGMEYTIWCGNEIGGSTKVCGLSCWSSIVAWWCDPAGAFIRRAVKRRVARMLVKYTH